MDDKRAPRNTRGDGDLLLLECLLGGTSDGMIERQEAQGQWSFVGSDTLPTDISPEDKSALEGMGVRFLGPVEGDDLFQYVELPEGWEKRPTDHSMWSTLLDAEGEEVASIFYKAAFYDRSTHLHLSPTESG